MRFVTGKTKTYKVTYTLGFFQLERNIISENKAKVPALLSEYTAYDEIISIEENK